MYDKDFGFYVFAFNHHWEDQHWIKLDIQNQKTLEAKTR